MYFQDTARLFLQSLGRSEEVEHYLNRFRSVRSPVFAILIPDLNVLYNSADSFLVQLHTLRRMGLTPAVLLGGPLLKPSLDLFCDAAFVTVEIDPVKPVVESVSLLPEPEGQKRIPVIYSPLPLIRTIPAVSEAYTGRIYIIRESGTFKSGTRKSYLCWIDESVVDENDKGIYDVAVRLKREQPDLHISVTSPYDLLKEIFTVKGAGTIIRYPLKIMRGGPDSIDRNTIIRMLEECFGKKLKDLTFLDQIREIIYEAKLRGAAVIERPGQYNYLSKFAVGVDARGDGVGQMLWDHMLSAYNSLFWRSGPDNTIHRWYEKIADGFQRTPSWNVYWRGIPHEDIGGVIQYCVQRPADFVDFTLPEKDS